MGRRGGLSLGAKDISKTIILRDGVSEPLRKITGKTAQYKKELQQLRHQGASAWSGLKMGAMALVGALSGGAGLLSAANDWAEAAKAQVEAETKLQAVLSHTPGMTQAGIDGIKQYAGELQNLGVIGDEVALSGVQQMGTYQLQASTLKKLMPSMNDLLTQTKGLHATQGDAVNIGNLLGKAMTGQVGALSRVGISFSKAQAEVLKFGTESQRAAVLSKVLEQNVGGVNAALASTDQGRIQQAANAYGDLKEGVGGAVLFVKAKFAGLFMDHLPQIQTAIEGVAASIYQWAENGGIENVISGVNTLLGVIGFLWDASMGICSLFWNNWSIISPVVYGVIGSLIAYKVTVAGVKAWTQATAASQKLLAWWTVFYGNAATQAGGKVRLLTLAQMGLNAAWNANPIGVIITLLGLVVTAGIYVIRNWEQVKVKAMQTWNTVVDAAEWAVNKYGTFVHIMCRVYIFAWDAIKYAGCVMWNFLLDAAQFGVNRIIQNANFLLKAYQFVWAWIEFGGKAMWKGILFAAEAGVNGFIGLVESLIQKALEGVNTLIRGVNQASQAVGMGSMMGELKFDGFKKVDLGSVKMKAEMPKWGEMKDTFSQVNFGTAKVKAEAPKWRESLFGKVNFKGAKFGEDTLLAQTRKVESRNKQKKKKQATKQNKLIEALNNNTKVTAQNTKATNTNTESKLRDQRSATDIADSLLTRIERHVWST